MNIGTRHISLFIVVSFLSLNAFALTREVDFTYYDVPIQMAIADEIFGVEITDVSEVEFRAFYKELERLPYGVVLDALQQKREDYTLYVCGIH